MINYSSSMDARYKRIEGLFGLYNDRRFAELMAFYSDDVACFLPVLADGDRPEMRLSIGKAEYLRNLEAYRETHGELRITSVFAVGCDSSILVQDSHGMPATFCFETSPEGLVIRVLVHHQLRRTGFEELPSAA